MALKAVLERDSSIAARLKTSHAQILLNGSVLPKSIGARWLMVWSAWVRARLLLIINLFIFIKV